MANTNRKRPANVSKKKKSKTNWRQIIIVSAVAIGLLAFLLPNILPLFTGGGPSVSPVTTGNTKKMPEPMFQKEGELAFVSSESGQPIQKIDIEKADNDMERQFGLMFRKSMQDTQGMLFLFDESEPQNFWMKNTLIPLDIMFVDENLKITTIHENTKPLSEKGLPSDGNAKYVVEVNGGFAKKYGVKVGDKISWQ